jgi:Fic family protein
MASSKARSHSRTGAASPGETVLERERHRLILKLVDERSIISIVQLVELLSASDATIRRDINALAEQGQLRRNHRRRIDDVWNG